MVTKKSIRFKSQTMALAVSLPMLGIYSFAQATSCLCVPSTSNLCCTETYDIYCNDTWRQSFTGTYAQCLTYIGTTLNYGSVDLVGHDCDAPISVTEGESSVSLTLNRSSANQQGVTIGYSTGEGSAKKNTDFVPTEGSLYWGCCEEGSKTIRIPLVNDTVAERLENFFVGFSNSNNSAVDLPCTSVEIAIQDNDTGTAQDQPMTASNVTGSVELISLSSKSTLTNDTQVSGGSTVMTGNDGSVTLTRTQGATVKLKKNSLLNIVPLSSTDTAAKSQRAADFNPLRERFKLSKGDQATVDNRLSKSERTALETQNSTTFLDAQTIALVSYSETAGKGTTTTSVTAGSVKLYDENGQLRKELTAGQSDTYTTTENRTDWVQPVDGAFVNGHNDNTLRWKVYSGASGYKLEYIFAPLTLSQANPPAPQYDSVLYFPRNQYLISNDMVSLNVFIPDLGLGTKLQARIFPTDNNGNLLPGSTGSDRVEVVSQ